MLKSILIAIYVTGVIILSIETRRSLQIRFNELLEKYTDENATSKEMWIWLITYYGGALITITTWPISIPLFIIYENYKDNNDEDEDK